MPMCRCTRIRKALWDPVWEYSRKSWWSSIAAVSRRLPQRSSTMTMTGEPTRKSRQIIRYGLRPRLQVPSRQPGPTAELAIDPRNLAEPVASAEHEEVAYLVDSG